MTLPLLVLLWIGLLTPQQGSAPQTWEAVAKEYDQAFEAWARELSRTGGWQKPEAERPPSPSIAFWPRFEALADQGDGRAVLWMLENLRGEGEARAEKLRSLFERVRAAGEAAWVASALHRLGGDHAGLDEEGLQAYLEAQRGEAKPMDLRVAAALAQAQLVEASDAAQASDLRVWAAFLQHQQVDLALGEALAPEDLSELATLVIEATDEAKQAHFDLAYREGSNGTYYPVSAAPPDPERVWSPVIEALAEKGSARARLWALSNAGWQLDEREKQRLTGYLDGLSAESMSKEELERFGYQIGGLVHRLGLPAVEPRVLELIETCDDAVKPRMLFGLADAICSTAGEDAAQRERGLGTLRQVRERWPDSEEARSAEGRIFLYTTLIVGKKIPDFEAIDADGNGFELSDYEGKVTVVDFWGFW